MKKHIFLAGILVMLLSSCSDFLDYNENSDYDQNKLFNTTWSNTDFVTGIYAYLPGALNEIFKEFMIAAKQEKSQKIMMREAKLRREEERIMMVDTSTMAPEQAAYYEHLKSEIMRRRFGSS